MHRTREESAIKMLEASSCMAIFVESDVRFVIKI